MAVALVTGAAKRVGAAIASSLISGGHTVVLHARRDDDTIKQTVSRLEDSGYKTQVVFADLTDQNARQKLISEAADLAGAPIDLLVNNASTFMDDRMGSVTQDSWDLHMKVNLEAPFFLSQDFADALPKDQTGLIVNIIDQRVWRLNPTFMSYTASKAALWTLTQTMAQALAPNIRVNAIGPGPVLPSVHQTDATFQAEAATVPLGKGPDVKEIASTIEFLLNTPSITGQMLALDGGQHLAWQTPDVMAQE